MSSTYLWRLIRRLLDILVLIVVAAYLNAVLVTVIDGVRAPAQYGLDDNGKVVIVR